MEENERLVLRKREVDKRHKWIFTIFGTYDISLPLRMQRKTEIFLTETALKWWKKVKTIDILRDQRPLVWIKVSLNVEKDIIHCVFYTWGVANLRTFKMFQ